MSKNTQNILIALGVTHLGFALIILFPAAFFYLIITGLISVVIYLALTDFRS